METMRTLVANDPRVYRELISSSLRSLRPLMEVSAALPEHLEQAVERVRPHLVICSGRQVGAPAWDGCLAWVVLYPEGEDLALIGGVGRSAALVRGVRLDDLLSVVDRTELLCRSGGDRQQEREPSGT